MTREEPKYPNSAGRLLAILESLQPNQPAVSQLVPLLLGETLPEGTKNLSLLGVKAITELHIIYAKFLEDLANANIGDEEKSVLEKGLVSLESLCIHML